MVTPNGGKATVEKAVGLRVEGTIIPRFIDKPEDLVVGSWYWVRRKDYPKGGKPVLMEVGGCEGTKYLSTGGGMRHWIEHTLMTNAIYGPVELPPGWGDDE